MPLLVMFVLVQLPCCRCHKFLWDMSHSTRFWLSYATVQLHALELHLISISAALKNQNQLTDTCVLQQSLTTNDS